MTRRKHTRLVRYVPVFGSPVWLPLDQAKKELKRDDDLYLRAQEAGAPLTNFPRIEDPRRRGR